MNEEALAEQDSLDLEKLCSQDIWLFVPFRYMQTDLGKGL